MKWNVKPLAPRNGSTRFVARFALLPVQMSQGGVVVWLEFYSEKQKYTEGLGWAMIWKGLR